MLGGWVSLLIWMLSLKDYLWLPPRVLFHQAIPLPAPPTSAPSPNALKTSPRGGVAPGPLLQAMGRPLAFRKGYCTSRVGRDFGHVLQVATLGLYEGQRETFCGARGVRG